MLYIILYYIILYYIILYYITFVTGVDVIKKIPTRRRKEDNKTGSTDDFVAVLLFFLIYLLACSITLVLVILHATYIRYYNNCFFVTISLFCVCPSVSSLLTY